jgi:hypothetical protein
MKPMAWLGILLIVVGGLALAYQGFTYTRQKKVLDVGPIHATADEHDRVSIPPIVGALMLVGGIVLVVGGSKKKLPVASRGRVPPESRATHGPLVAQVS